MKVRATKPGFYQRLYSPGEEFCVPAELFSGQWMEKLEEPEPATTVEQASGQAEKPSERATEGPSRRGRRRK